MNSESRVSAEIEVTDDRRVRALHRDYLLTHGTVVYRLYNAAGALLYVGITGTLYPRLADHAKKPWWPQVTRKTATWYTDREEGLAAEAAAIRTEKPLYNVIGGQAPRAQRRQRRRPALVSVPNADGTRDVAIEDARMPLGGLVRDAQRAGVITYLTQHGRRTAAIIPLDRISEEPAGTAGGQRGA